MQELIEKLKSLHGLSNEQASGVLQTVSNFIKEKYPMVAGAVDNIFPQQSASGSNAGGDTGGTTEGPAQKGGSFTDDIPGVDGLKDKLGGTFGK